MNQINKDIGKAIIDNFKKGAPYAIDGEFCSICGSELEVEPEGDENEPAYLYCPKCNVKVRTHENGQGEEQLTQEEAGV